MQRGRDLKRIHYFNPSPLIRTGLIYEIFAKFEDKIYGSKIPHNELLDSGRLIRLRSSILETCLSVLRELKRFFIEETKNTALLHE